MGTHLQSQQTLLNLVVLHTKIYFLEVYFYFDDRNEERILNIS